MGSVTTRMTETRMARGVGSSIESTSSRMSAAIVILAEESVTQVVKELASFNFNIMLCSALQRSVVEIPPLRYIL